MKNRKLRHWRQALTRPLSSSWGENVKMLQMILRTNRIPCTKEMMATEPEWKRTSLQRESQKGLFY